MIQFSAMDNSDLLRHVHTSHNPLTTTAPEIELAKRLDQANDEIVENEPLVEMLRNRYIFGSDADKLKADLQLLEDLKAVLAEHNLPDDAIALGVELDALAKTREAMFTPA